MLIYQLEHEYWKADYDPSGFRLGYYASLEEAKEAREQYLSLPGFIDHPEGFRITKHIVHAESCSKIWSVDLVFDEYMDDFIAVGVFEDRGVAEKYIEQYRLLRGDEVEQGRFLVEEHDLGQGAWEEGFITYYYTEED